MTRQQGPSAEQLAAAMADPCAALNELRLAYYQLLAGKTRTVVRFNDRWTEFAPGDAKVLQAEIRRLEIICGNSGAHRARAAI